MNRFLLAGLLAHASAFAATHVLSYRAEIRGSATAGFTVDIAVKAGPDVWQKPVQIIERAGSKITDLQVISGGGTVPAHVESVGLVDRLTAEQPVQEYGIRYRVEADPSGHARIPLAVPEIATAGAAGAVIIAVYSDSGDIIAGDTFPSLYGTKPGVFTAELANVPSHVRLAEASANSHLFPVWFTPSRLSDLAVIALLVIGSIVRATMRQKSEA